MNIVLVGNPNAGKTTLFNSLTCSNFRTGNFHGVTCDVAKKEVRRGDKSFVYVDVPGLYSFKPYTMEEATAIEEIRRADVIVNVVDGLTLKNSLSLTRAMIATGKPVILYVTKLNALSRRGGFLNAEKLAAHLGVLVFVSHPKDLKNALECGAILPVKKEKIPLNEAYFGGNLKISPIDRLFYNRFFAVFVFIVAMLSTFFFAFHSAMPGAKLKGFLDELLCVRLCGEIIKNLKSEVIISLIAEGIFGGAAGVVTFLPQLVILYLSLAVLDESGIMSALSFSTDGLFEKVSLSGRAAFSLVSGFGCTSAAILTTRGYSSLAAQKKTVAVLPFIPCGAKTPVFLTFLAPLFENPFLPISFLYFFGTATAVVASAFLGGRGEGLLFEVAPIIPPQIKAVAIKLSFQLKGFIMKVAGVVFVFCILSWALSHYSFEFKFTEPDESMLAVASRLLVPLFRPLGFDDWRIAYAALCGFVAKENVSAAYLILMPNDFVLSGGAALSFCVFILFSPACVSALTASAKELGLKFTLKCVAVQLLIAFVAGYAFHFCYEKIFGF